MNISNIENAPDLRRISHEEFQALKEGDLVLVNTGGKFYKSRVLGKPFYNHDSSEPGWEVETNNCFCDELSLYV